ncbi:MAG: cohesin domain-containing protein [bacterium]
MVEINEKLLKEKYITKRGNNKKVLLLFCVLFCVSFAFKAQAVELSFNPPIKEININQNFQVDFIINTENEDINAIEGEIVFPSDLLELKEIKDGNSIVNFWIERPSQNSKFHIPYSGIIPGGYKSASGFLFSLVFQSKASGSSTIEILNARVLLNDGQGTKAELSLGKSELVINQQSSVFQSPASKFKDINPPEAFPLEISSDSTMFDGKYFLVFATQDKGSGIDHYEIRERREDLILKLIKKFPNSIRQLADKIPNSGYIIGESPYLLKDQELKSYIYVKAVDKTGNERISKLKSVNPLPWYEKYLLFGIIITGIIFASIILRILWMVKIKKL